MSKLRFTAAALSLAAISSFPAAPAQTPAGQPAGQPVQAGQPTTPPSQPVDQQNRSKSDQQEKHKKGHSSENMGQQQGPTVKEALTQKLIKSNEGEIELAKLAQQKTDNEELKQLAGMIIKDHQELNQTLQQHAEKHLNQSQAGKSQPGRAQPGQANDDVNRQSQTSSSATSHAATVPKALCKISELACENALKMTKEMLNNYEGQDFNMAFLGQQWSAHTMMLAELKAIESAGPKELQQIASQAAAKVEKHLEKVKQLAKQLEGNHKSRS